MIERHFRARVPRTFAEQPRPVDIIVTAHFGAKSVRPVTERGREFLREFYSYPITHDDQAISLMPGRRHVERFKTLLREQGLRATYDGSGNGREVE